MTIDQIKAAIAGLAQAPALTKRERVELLVGLLEFAMARLAKLAGE